MQLSHLSTECIFGGFGVKITLGEKANIKNSHIKSQTSLTYESSIPFILCGYCRAVYE